MADQGRVVVGVDGSSAGRRALRWALAEARLRSLSLEVLHAWREPALFVPAGYDTDLVEAGATDRAALELVERELKAVGPQLSEGIRVERIEVHGLASRALVDASQGAAMVVVGRRGVGRFPRELIGPKAIQVAHHARSPVVVVPEQRTADAHGVVVGVDGSDEAAHAVRWAHDEATRRGCTLTAVLAWGLLEQHHADCGAPFDPKYGTDNARSALDAAVNSALVGASSDIVERQVVNDLPANGLIAASTSAELLVVGARGLGGFRGLLLGSVSQRCLTHARCPSVVVR